MNSRTTPTPGSDFEAYTVLKTTRTPRKSPQEWEDEWDYHFSWYGPWGDKTVAKSQRTRIENEHASWDKRELVRVEVFKSVRFEKMW